MNENIKPRLVGINHVALEVGNIDDALAFYARIFTFELRGRGEKSAFIDIGDQFIAFTEGRTQGADDGRHFGLVVDDRSQVRELAEAAGAKILEGGFLDFLDPWGNRIQVVEYRDLQFMKTTAVLKFMEMSLDKSEEVKAELYKKGIKL